MTKLKKILKFQLAFFPLLAALIYIIIVIINHYQNSNYKELSSRDFIEKVITNRVSEINIINNRYEITVSRTGEKYFHVFTTVEKNELERKIPNDFSLIFNYKKSYTYWVPLFLGLILLTILIINIVIVWFISMFDLLKSEFTNNSNKWIWLISLMFMPFVAPFFYLVIAEKQKCNAC